MYLCSRHWTCWRLSTTLTVVTILKQDAPMLLTFRTYYILGLYYSEVKIEVCPKAARPCWLLLCSTKFRTLEFTAMPTSAANRVKVSHASYQSRRVQSWDSVEEHQDSELSWPRSKTNSWVAGRFESYKSLHLRQGQDKKMIGFLALILTLSVEIRKYLASQPRWFKVPNDNVKISAKTLRQMGFYCITGLIFKQRRYPKYRDVGVE